jgi:hypothetical protein
MAKSKLPRGYKTDANGNPVVFDVIDSVTGLVVSSSPSRVASRNHITKVLDPSDSDRYRVEPRSLVFPKEDLENPALASFEEHLRSYGAGILRRCADATSGTVFEEWRLVADLRSLILVVFPGGRYNLFTQITPSFDSHDIITAADSYIRSISPA